MLLGDRNKWLNDNYFISFSHELLMREGNKIIVICFKVQSGISNQSWKRGFGTYQPRSQAPPNPQIPGNEIEYVHESTFAFNQPYLGKGLLTKGLFICTRDTRMSWFPETYWFHRGFIWSHPSWVTGMCLFHQKKRWKVDNNLSIKRKLILFAYIASQRMLVSFLAFFFGGFTWSNDVLNFIVYFIRNTAFIWTKIYPAWSGSRSRETSRSPYKQLWK